MICLFSTICFFATSTIANGNAQHLSQISVLKDSVSSKAAQENLIWSNIQNKRQTTADMLDIDNSNIMVSAIHEDNEKKVNEVYLNTIAKGNYDYNASYLSVLEQVASQCPWEGGNAVFRARGMLALVQRVIINDESMCNSAKSLMETFENEPLYEENVIELDLGISIFPNPANDVLNIEFKEELNSNSEVQLFDINGRVIKRLQFKTGEKRFELFTSNIAVGIYFLRIADNNGNQIANHKIVIIR